MIGGGIEKEGQLGKRRVVADDGTVNAPPLARDLLKQQDDVQRDAQQLFHALADLSAYVWNREDQQAFDDMPPPLAGALQAMNECWHPDDETALPMLPVGGLFEQGADDDG